MKRIYILVFLLFFLTACGQHVTEEDLIGGIWVATAGYKDGEAKGEPNCFPLEEGNKFKNGDTVYNATFDRDFEYWLYEYKGNHEIHFEDSNPGEYNYQIKKISDDEIVLQGLDYSTSKGRACYLERK